MNIKDFIECARGIVDCRVYPPNGFHETYGLAGNIHIIARNFTELLESLIENEGKSIFWLQDTFEPLVDAYDRVE